MSAEAPEEFVVEVQTLGSAEPVAVRVPATASVAALREAAGAALGSAAGDLKLVLGDRILGGGGGAEEELLASVFGPHGASGPVQLTAIKVPRRVVAAETREAKTFRAGDHPRPWTAQPGCPTQGDYDHTSGHYWANHSGGGAVLRLQCTEAAAQIVEVRARAVAKDQGWGGTNECGVCVVLLAADGSELAYSVQSLQGHGDKTLEWTMTPEEHGGSFPAKGGEEAFGSVCACGEGLALEMRAFTPNYGGWSVNLTEGDLSATVVG